ncbi:MAG: hypothetical protein REI96_22425 [Flavobacterium nitrogenifigens]|uniref:hypothetical protein n=1 Tax=Flavobacterium TaxID=237 RepID=UPI000DAC5239|nr:MULTISPECIES: hypothetical protein [Flavobacterium]KAF2334512.1 hypothetical protein DM397_07520 [Flavobacterium nitrogenifigens]MDQ6529138.1 hypothetical protein [Flavobacterium sp. LHD-85]MDQ8015219.1 hypothetical protein [Flavobacterium nitrogenifigens]
MKILKKITGVIILIFTVLLCFPAFYAFPIQFENCKKKFETGVVGAPGYAIGFLTCLVFYFLITYFLIKLSLKLIRQRKNNIASIDEIGLKE